MEKHIEQRIDNNTTQFLQTNSKSHFLQSPEWAKVKSNWKHEMIVIKENNEIRGTMSILLRKVPIINRYIMYAPRGFVCDIYNKDTLKKLTEKAKEIAKKYKAFIFRLDPDISKEDNQFKGIIKDLGYKTKSNIRSIDDVVQPKYVYRLNLKGKTEESLLMSFEQKTRYNIRLAEKKGIKIKEGTRKDLKTFYDILLETGKRDKFFIRPFSYFEKIYDNMKSRHVKIFIAEYKNEPIAASMLIIYGNKSWYLYGGSLNKYRNFMPNYLLQFEMMKCAIENNCEIYDFRGVSGFKDKTNPQYGVYRFKKGFNGDFIEFIDELYIVFNPFINIVFNTVIKVYKRICIIKQTVKKLLKDFQ